MYRWLQVSKSNVNWVVALYDYAGKSADDLSFQQGDCILVTEQLSADWSRGSVNGRDGMFPTAFVESTTGMKCVTGQGLCGKLVKLGFV